MLINKLAKLVSAILYPGVTAALFSFIFFFGIMGVGLKIFLFALVYSCLVALVPFLILNFLSRRGRISDREIIIKEGRRVFFQTAMPAYFLAFLFLLLIKAPKPIFLLGGIGMIIFVAIHYLVSPVYKVSVHVGGLTFNIITVGLVLDERFYYFLPLIPLLAWSRYQLKKHTLGQSFWGALIGAGIPFIIYQFFI